MSWGLTFPIPPQAIELKLHHDWFVSKICSPKSVNLTLRSWTKVFQWHNSNFSSALWMVYEPSLPFAKSCLCDCHKLVNFLKQNFPWGYRAGSVFVFFFLCWCKPHLSPLQIITFPALGFGALIGTERQLQSFCPFFKLSPHEFLGSL